MMGINHSFEVVHAHYIHRFFLYLAELVLLLINHCHLHCLIVSQSEPCSMMLSTWWLSSSGSPQWPKPQISVVLAGHSRVVLQNILYNTLIGDVSTGHLVLRVVLV